MEDIFEIYKYKYKEIIGNANCYIYARSDETAQELIDIANSYSIWKFKPARFFFKRKCYINVPPYELEQKQFERQRAAAAKRAEMSAAYERIYNVSLQDKIDEFHIRKKKRNRPAGQ